MDEKICRLCLQTINGNYQTAEQCLENTLKLNMDISKAPVKCIDCTNNLEVFLKLKSTCDYISEQILPTALKDDIDVNLEMTEISDNLLSLIQPKNEMCCRFCSKTSEREDLTSLNESKEHKFLVDVLKEHIPKLYNLNKTDDLLTCETCLDGLQRVLSFITKCMNVEREIIKYTEINGTDDKGQIILKDVQQFIIKPTIKFENEFRDENELLERSDQFQEGYNVQGEIKYEKEVDTPELFIKSEEINIKSEQSDCDRFQEPSTIIKTGNEALDVSTVKSRKRPKKYANQDESTYTNSEGIKMHRCGTCSYQTSRKYYLRQHDLIHKSAAEVATFRCELCSYEAKIKRYLTQHKLTHRSTAETTTYKCGSCPYETNHRAYFRKHRWTHNSAAESPTFRCDLCAYEAKCKDYLRRHKFTHKSAAELTMFGCDQCSYEGRRKYDLKQHKLTHKSASEITMFKCQFCSYQAKRMDRLKQHSLLHNDSSDVTIFKCELCPYESKYRTYLQRHKLTHKSASELVMFNCDQCAYKAKRKDILKRHISRRHGYKAKRTNRLLRNSSSDVLMVKCDLCPYKSKYRTYLQRHKLTHKSASELTMFKCGFCSYESKRKDVLKRHVSRQHDDARRTSSECPR